MSKPKLTHETKNQVQLLFDSRAWEHGASRCQFIQNTPYAPERETNNADTLPNYIIFQAKKQQHSFQNKWISIWHLSTAGIIRMKEWIWTDFPARFFFFFSFFFFWLGRIRGRLPRPVFWFLVIWMAAMGCLWAGDIERRHAAAVMHGLIRLLG